MTKNLNVVCLLIFVPSSFSAMWPGGREGECGLRYWRADGHLEHLCSCRELHHRHLQRNGSVSVL